MPEDLTSLHEGPDSSSRTSRRQFLRASLATGGCWLLGVYVRTDGAAANKEMIFEPNAFIRIEHDGTIRLIMPQVEMGQGIYTALATILAEELDAAYDRIVLEAAPPSDNMYANPKFQFQATGGSTSVRAFWLPLRKTAAIARQVLVQAAALHLKVAPSSLTTSNSEVVHGDSGQRLAYGSLVQSAQALTPPKDAPLKEAKNFVLIGKSLKRFDTPEKVDGRMLYGIDAMPTGLKFATLATSPVFGGRVGHVDDSKAKAVSGVQQVIVFEDFVAVVAEHTWAAMQGLAALSITWDEGTSAHISSQNIWEKIRSASLKKGVVARHDGDVPSAFKKGELHEAVYELPLLAHAAMEPMNCTAHVTASGCEIWVGTQVLTRAQGVAMKVTGFSADKIVIHNQQIGGSFGRRLYVDAIEKALMVAQKTDAPVKLTWSREEDIQHDFYRPAYVNRLSATVAGARVHGWTQRIAGSSIFASWLPPAFKNGLDTDALDQGVDTPYELPNCHVEYLEDEPYAVPTGFWRGVGANNNVFAVESFMDELARQSGVDPVAFRLAHLGNAPRLQAALKLAAENSNWGGPLPQRTGRGVSVSGAFGSYACAVVQARVDEDGTVYVERVVMAIDTGIVVNPDTVVAQMQGGIIFGLTAALYGRIDIERGRTLQSNFHDYRVMRINEMPTIEVHIIPSAEPPGGIGEAGTSVAAPALTNALFAATAVRLRRLPVDQVALKRGKPS